MAGGEFNTPSLQIADPEMPYGKYAGRPLCEVPTQYLRWVYRDWNFSLLPELQRAIEAYLGIPADPEIRCGTPEAQAFNPAARRAGPGSQQPVADGRPWGAPETGLGGLQRAFERARREALLEFEDEPEIRDLLEETLGKVRKALGI
jgi:uncharacterized protein (DUF3820 family)